MLLAYLKKHYKNIDWFNLSDNYNAIDLISNNLHKN